MQILGNHSVEHLYQMNNASGLTEDFYISANGEEVYFENLDILETRFFIRYKFGRTSFLFKPQKHSFLAMVDPSIPRHFRTW